MPSFLKGLDIAHSLTSSWTHPVMTTLIRLFCYTTTANAVFLRTDLATRIRCTWLLIHFKINLMVALVVWS